MGNKFEVISFEEFKKVLLHNRNFGVSDENSYFKLKCGVASYQKIMEWFLEECRNTLNTVKSSDSINLIGGYVVKTIFIAGFGWIELSHTPEYDKPFNREINIPMISGLPLTSYNFSLSTNDKEVYSGTIIKENVKLTIFKRLKSWFINLFK